jgi:hypothetical protein
MTHHEMVLLGLGLATFLVLSASWWLWFQEHNDINDLASTSAPPPPGGKNDGVGDPQPKRGVRYRCSSAYLAAVCRSMSSALAIA